VHMPDGEEWLWRPVMRGLCKYESLVDGTLSLQDIGRMNEALDIERENQARQRESMKD
jgi:hypothetical protein